MAARPRAEGVQLESGQRIWFTVVGALFLVLAILYLVIPRTVTVVAPQCAKSSDGCTVSVSASADPAVMVVLLALSGASFLVAIVGYAVTIEIAGIKLGWGAVTASEKEAEAAPQLSTTATLGGGGSLSATATSHLPSPVPLEHSRVLYRELPLDVAYAADKTWRDRHPDSTLSDVINDIRHEDGQGNKPWFLNLRQPNGDLIWLKISKGGQGKRGPTSGFQDPDD